MWMYNVKIGLKKPTIRILQKMKFSIFPTQDTIYFQVGSPYQVRMKMVHKMKSNLWIG